MAEIPYISDVALVFFVHLLFVAHKGNVLPPSAGEMNDLQCSTGAAVCTKWQS